MLPAVIPGGPCALMRAVSIRARSARVLSFGEVIAAFIWSLTQDDIGIGNARLLLWTVTVLAAVSGSRLSRFLKSKLLNATSGLLLAAIGI